MNLVLKRDNVIESVKDYLKMGEDALRERHMDGASGHEVVKDYTCLIDNFLKTLYAHMETELRKSFRDDFNYALIALGGYGRGELNIRSDIDLMFLYPKKLSPSIERLTERILYVLWDTGLDIGFSVRSLKECISLAKEDIKTKTALLDSRYIAGDKDLFEELALKTRKSLFSEKDADRFIKEKLDESRLRHAKYGGTVYILEPNVKEGEGGLRDIHTAIWTAKIKCGATGLEGLRDNGFLPDNEFRHLYDSIDFLWKVRNELHFESKKKTDQLTFDYQKRIAKLFHFKDTAESLGVEKFMQTYYLHASNIFHYSSLITSRCIHGYMTDFSGYVCDMEKDIDGDFRLCSSLICVKDHELFKEKPCKMMRAFELSCMHNTGLDNLTRELLLKNLHLIDDSVRSSKETVASFLNILKSGMSFETLQEMHMLRFLGRIIPEFNDITCRVQHDMYHIYTVDAHSLFAVRELEKLRTFDYKKDFFLLTTIFEEVTRPELLILGVLLHDIGKSMGKGHAEKGAEITERILKRFGLPEEDIELVKFLVRYHLILPDTAQHRDIHDEKLVIEFAKKIVDINRLNLLYLLAFADIRAVGPDVWNQWKAALFQELYFKALTVIERGTFEIEDAVKRIHVIIDNVSNMLAGEIDRGIVENYFRLLPQRYFLSNSREVIAEHIRVVEQLGSKLFTMDIRHNTERNYTEVTICTPDMHGLFSKITGVMAANNINILGAQINTLKNGIALDVLQVNTPSGDMITDEMKWERVRKAMTDVLTGTVYIESLLAKKRKSILDRKPKPPVPSSVEIDNEVSDEFTVIDIHAQDRVGLLYDITSSLSKLGLYIYVSKIATRGSEAADIFYVKDIFGQKVYYSEKLKEIKETLLKAVSSGE